MAENESKPTNARRYWRIAYGAACLVAIAALSPPLLGFLAIFGVGGAVVRGLWSLRP